MEEQEYEDLYRNMRIIRDSKNNLHIIKDNEQINVNQKELQTLMKVKKKITKPARKTKDQIKNQLKRQLSTEIIQHEQKQLTDRQKNIRINKLKKLKSEISNTKDPIDKKLLQQQLFEQQQQQIQKDLPKQQRNRPTQNKSAQPTQYTRNVKDLLMYMLENQTRNKYVKQIEHDQQKYQQMLKEKEQFNVGLQQGFINEIRKRDELYLKQIQKLPVMNQQEQNETINEIHEMQKQFKKQLDNTLILPQQEPIFQEDLVAQRNMLKQTPIGNKMLKLEKQYRSMQFDKQLQDDVAQNDKFLLGNAIKDQKKIDERQYDKKNLSKGPLIYTQSDKKSTYLNPDNIKLMKFPQKMSKEDEAEFMAYYFKNKPKNEEQIQQIAKQIIEERPAYNQNIVSQIAVEMINQKRLEQQQNIMKKQIDEEKQNLYQDVSFDSQSDRGIQKQTQLKNFEQNLTQKFKDDNFLQKDYFVPQKQKKFYELNQLSTLGKTLEYKQDDDLDSIIQVVEPQQFYQNQQISQQFSDSPQQNFDITDPFLNKQFDNENINFTLQQSSQNPQQQQINPNELQNIFNAVKHGNSRQKGYLNDTIRNISMDSEQIQNFMNESLDKKDLKHFLGVFKKDDQNLEDLLKKINLQKEQQIFWIQNTTNKANSNENHWYSIFITPESYHIFDSSGQNDIEQINNAKKYIQILQPDLYLKLKINSNKVQSDKNNFCGMFSVLFILRMLNSNENFEYSSMQDLSQQQGEKLVQKTFELI